MVKNCVKLWRSLCHCMNITLQIKTCGIKKSFKLLHENSIVHYDVENFDNSASHGNSNGMQVFRPTMHSVKHKFKETLSSTTKLPRFIMNDFEKEQDIFSCQMMLLFPKMLIRFIILTNYSPVLCSKGIENG